MKVLIIGGTRFMGPDVAAGLVEQGHEVTLFHRGMTARIDLEDVEQIIGDRDRIDNFSSRIRQFRPDVVLDMILLNERQAQDLINTISGFAGHLVVVSSCDVYRRYDLLRGVETGPVDNFALTEDAPLREKLYPYRDQASGLDDRYYNYDKILVEKTVMGQTDLPATVLRLPFVYGPRDYQHRLYEYVKRMDDKRPAIILEDYQAASRMTRGYRTNCAEAILLAVNDDRAAGHIYNVGDEEALSEKEWVLKIAEVTGWEGKIVTVQQDKLPGHLCTGLNWEHHMNVDTSRIRVGLDYSEIVPQMEAIEKTVAWERKNPPPTIPPGQFDYGAEDKLMSEI